MASFTTFNPAPYTSLIQFAISLEIRVWLFLLAYGAAGFAAARWWVRIPHPLAGLLDDRLTRYRDQMAPIPPSLFWYVCGLCAGLYLYLSNIPILRDLVAPAFIVGSALYALALPLPMFALAVVLRIRTTRRAVQS
jgi:hypothetical protein